MRSRAAAGLLLLAVTAHAFVGSATHFHRAAAPEAQSAHAVLTGSERGGRSAPLPGDAAQCILCRLQRNFVSDVQDAALAVAPLPAEPPGYEDLRDISARATRSLLRSGRAPPSA